MVGPDTDRTSLTSFTGWEVRGGASAGPGAGDTRALSEAVPGRTVECYELLAVTGRGFGPPRFLTIAEESEESEESEGSEGAQRDPVGDRRGAGSDALPDLSGFRRLWSLLYRRIVETGPQEVAPFAIYLLGVNPPAGAGDDDLEEFDDFYTNVHLPEVAERRQALRAVRYELEREVKPPYRGAPRFLAIYEIDEAGASRRSHTGPPYSKGPEVWQGHKTPWRLWYRLLGGNSTR